jgi:hypothetical protein
MNRFTAAQRQTLAIRTAQIIAEEYGVRTNDPIILKDTNHTLVHLLPEPIVAKVSVEKKIRQRSSSLGREVIVARLLADAGAPVVRPADALPAGPHYVDGVELTFWDFCPHDRGAEIPPHASGKAL